MKSRLILPRQFLLFILILALSSQACTVSLFQPAPAGAGTPSVPTGPTATPAPRAQVTFRVQLPEPLQPNEILAISVLDEVTGLALNPVDYQMTQGDATSYSATLTIPDQAVVKYRYVKRGAASVAEDTNDDQVIRYRLLYINGPTEVMDTVNSWADKPVNTISGTISGTVVNTDTGAPIPEILVTAGGVQ